MFKTAGQMIFRSYKLVIQNAMTYGNDVRDPNCEMERIHVNLESLELQRTNADGVTKKIREQSPSGKA
jgi:hypothetical protein